ncbi:MAG: hypothetical protein AB1439_07440 [candidate division FCPU426 bacterium]
MPKLLIFSLLLVCWQIAVPSAWAQTEEPQVQENADPEQAAAYAEPDANEASPPEGNPGPSALLRAPGHAWATITRHLDDHLLITLGDQVCLSPNRKVAMHAGEIHYIYHFMDQEADRAESRKTGWLKQVGKLEILSNQEGLTIGRVLAARDIIQAGDQVLLQTE